MSQTSLSVWFVCKLCRGSFGQVDAFIEHKKQKHFNEFQNTTCIVFEEREQGLLYPVTTNEDPQLADDSIEPPVKVEVKDEDLIIPFCSEVIDDPNLDLVEPKSELVTYENEIIPDMENNFLGFGLEQPEQNPYVLLKRLTSEEIQIASILNHHSTRLRCEQKNLLNGSFDSYTKIISQNEAETSTETSPASTVTSSTGDDLQFECKLCSKRFESDARLKIHVGICALYNKNRNRFCVTCNRKFCKTDSLKNHRLRFHGTEEEKLSLYKFKCHVCPKRYRRTIELTFHLKSHKETTEQVETLNSKSRKCPHPSCGKDFRCNSELQRHVPIHSDLRPFSCSFPNCNRTFRQRAHLNSHFVYHCGERSYKCTVDNCNKTYIFSSDRSRHIRIDHSN